jgi:ankyrin repeat protein
MPSMSISQVRSKYPDKTDAELAAIVAAKDGYIVVVRYKAAPTGSYTDFGCCRNTEELIRYLNSPHCYAPEVAFDRRTDMGEKMSNAVFYGHIDTVRDLLNQGANPNTLTGRVLNPLLVEVFTGPLDEAIRLKIIKLLLDYGADTNLENTNGATALEVASGQGDVDSVNAILSKGVIVNVANRALHGACQNGHLEVVRALLNHGADINSKDGYGNTSLHSVCNRFRENESVIAIVTELLSQGADLHVKNNQGYTVLGLANISNLSLTVALLREHGAE